MAVDNQLRSEAEERRLLLEDLAYDVSLSLDGVRELPTFRSRTIIDFTCGEDGADTFVNLTAATVHRVALNGDELDAAGHGFDGHRLRLSGLRSGRNRLEVLADCEYGHTGVGLHRFRDPADGTMYLYTHLEPFDAHRVLACFDQPDLKGTLTLHVDAPEGWVVCANAPPQGSHSTGGRTQWDFGVTPPLPPYLFAVVAGEYEVLEGPPYRGTPLRLMSRRSLSEYLHQQAPAIFEITARGLEYFEHRYGHDYPFGDYVQVFVPEANMGAMENPGCVTFNEAALFRGTPSATQMQRRANVILHEMVHVMGFGDVVTMSDWGDLWLNETFATVEATIAMDALGIPGAWVDFAGSVKSRALFQDQLSTTHPILVDAPDTESIRANFDGITYHKGASVLRQLIAWVGSKHYAAGIRSYFAEFFWSNASRTDFLGHQSRRSGRDLDDWAQLWLETAGVNTLVPQVTVAQGYYTSVLIAQHPDAVAGVLRPHRVKVGLYDRDDDRISRRTSVSLDLTDDETFVDGLVGQPAADLLIANDDDLTFAKLRFDEGSLATLLGGGVSAIDDAHARSLCWTALHDMARDGELPAGDFVAAAAAQAPFETDDLLLERLLALAVGVADRYSADGQRPGQLAALAITASAQITAGTSPLVWARCLAATARTGSHLALLRRLLDGALTVPYLDVDVDLRWALLARLVTEGRAGAAEVDAALELDPTDEGQRRAISCLAARPEADAKAQVWRSVTEDASLSRARIAAALHGFSTGPFPVGGFHAAGRDQVALTAPYVERYLELVPRLWVEREYEVARALTEGLFPREPVDAATIGAVETLIDSPDVPWNGRRVLMEGRDGLARAQRTRAADRS